jgi:hypothetical protein
LADTVVGPLSARFADVVQSARERLETACQGRGDEASVIAIGWATVETERAEVELLRALGDGLGPFVDAPDDELLGARCRSAAAGTPPFVVVLEPSTEGRLAGSLARIGEGPVAVWFSLEAGPVDGASDQADGPFGRERLVVGGPREGRHVLLLDGPPGTISA